MCPKKYVACSFLERRNYRNPSQPTHSQPGALLSLVRGVTFPGLQRTRHKIRYCFFSRPLFHNLSYNIFEVPFTSGQNTYVNSPTKAFLVSLLPRRPTVSSSSSLSPGLWWQNGTLHILHLCLILPGNYGQKGESSQGKNIANHTI